MNIYSLEIYPRDIIRSACFGVAGPVINGRAKITNLPWSLSEREIIQQTGIRKVKLVNDLVATTEAIPCLEKNDIVTLHPGESNQNSKVCAVLAPGTGLGVAFLIYLSGAYQAFPSEGGHADFAPSTGIEIELLQYLKTKFHHVSYERILCGKGLVTIYEFLKEAYFVEELPEIRQRFQSHDPAAVISTMAIKEEDKLCVQALDIFTSILGAQAGNLALTFMANGGIYLGGGIPPKILKKLTDGSIVSAYLNKGRLSDVVLKMPLHVIGNDHAAILGAASIAAKLSAK